MFYHAASDTYIQHGQPFVLAGIQYPANWLNLASPSDKQAAGLTEVSTSGSPGNPNEFFVSENLVNGVRVITNTPKPAAMLAAAEQAQIDTLLTRVRVLRKEILERLIGIAFAAKETDDPVTVQHCLTARAGLLTITDALPNTLSAVEQLIFTRYIGIREALPESLKNTFAGLDL